MKRLTSIVIGAAVVLLLAGAAFMAARLWSNKEQEVGLGGLAVAVNGDAKAGQPLGVVGAAQAIKIEMVAAPELPKTPETVNGVFVRREDNSFFVGTGNLKLSMTMEQNGGGVVNADYDGPVIEVVVTRDTLLYRDETPAFFSKADLSGEVEIQQVVRQVDAPEGLGENSTIRVWGQQRGDRVVAEVLVYQTL
jgi:hypothetical protein